MWKLFLITILTGTKAVASLSTLSYYPNLTNPEKWLQNTFKNCAWRLSGNFAAWKEKIIFFAYAVPVVVDHDPYFHESTNEFLLDKRTSSSSLLTNIVNESNNRWDWYSGLRYRLCNIRLFNFEYSNKQYEVASAVTQKPFVKSLTAENAFAVIFSLCESTASLYEQKIRHGIEILSVTSIYLMYHTNIVKTVSSEIYGKSGSIALKLTQLTTPEGLALIQTEWKKATRNLQNRCMLYELDTLGWYPGHNWRCNLRFANIHSTARLCSKNVLAIVYNATVLPRSMFGATNWWLALRNTVSNDLIMKNDAINRTFFKTKHYYEFNVWIPYGYECVSYRYVLFATPTHDASIKVLLTPFTTASALFPLISFLLVYLFLCVCYKIYVNNFGASSQFKVFMFQFKCLLEQGDSSFMERISLRSAGSLCVFVWLFAAYIVSNEYKGCLYSVMTSDPIPTVPESVADLVLHTSIPYYIMKHYRNSYGETTQLMHNVIDDYPNKLKHLTYDQVVQKFIESCLIFLSNPRVVFRKMANNLKVYTNKGMAGVSENFVLISENEDMNLFAALIKRHMNMFVIPGKKLSSLNSPMPWFGIRNRFAQLMSTGLSRLEQSGIYHVWNKYSRLHLLAYNLKHMDERFNAGKARMYSYFDLALHTINFRRALPEEFASPISMSIIDKLLVFCSILNVLSVTLFLLEKWVKTAKKVCKLVLNIMFFLWSALKATGMRTMKVLKSKIPLKKNKL